MRTISCDCLVVGAGLAGSTLGFLLRGQGRDVLALELRDLSRKDKLCAGILIPWAVETFAGVYGEGELERLAPHVSPDWRWRTGELEIRDGKECLVVRRRRLDDYCLERFLDAGGCVLDRTRLVSVNEDERVAECLDLRAGERFRVSYEEIVGADGAMSSVRRLLTGGNGRTVLSFEGVVPQKGGTILSGIDANAVGYCWYAPRGGDATVGCVYRTLDVDESRERLARFCDGLGIQVPPLRSAPIPSGDDFLLRAGQRAWLVGDAAGLADALGSGGIHNALDSVRLLAESLAGGTPYEEVMRPILAELGLIGRRVGRMNYELWLSIILRGKPYGAGVSGEGA